jgi:hypothetical protein
MRERLREFTRTRTRIEIPGRGCRRRAAAVPVTKRNIEKHKHDLSSVYHATESTKVLNAKIRKGVDAAVQRETGTTANPSRADPVAPAWCKFRPRR